MWWALIGFLSSAVVVDLAGYWLHRWAHSPSSPLYRPHMTHHVRNYPPREFLSDRYRSSGSDNLAIWFAPFGVIYALIVIISGMPHQVPILLGGAVAAVANAVMHDLTHIKDSVAWRSPWLRSMSVYHRVHHSHMRRNYGLLSSCWDRLFGTMWRGRVGREGRRAPRR
jgi:sterol desaturase/sphingolipid hydroxylase (fatty acid hydroxylase superfamily)